MSQQSNIQFQPQFYEHGRSEVEQRLWGELRNPDDGSLLQMIFQSSEWISQSTPIPEDLIRQLRHQFKTPSELEYFACPFCTVTEWEANHMTEHIQTHFGLKPYCCFQCGQMSLRKRDAEVHIQTHNPQEIPCPRGCGQLFTSQKNIKRHLEKSCRGPAI